MIVATRKSEQNEAWIDPWTVVHFGVGLAFGLMRFSFLGSMLAASAYEIFEQALERSQAGQDLFETSGPERPGNIVIDISVFAVGHYLGQLWNRT